MAGTLAAAGQAPDRTIVEDLRKGGYVLYVRHFQTNRTQDDTDPLHLDNVAAQRHLTDAGREQAAAVGKALRTLGIPIDRVVCSQFERAAESARLMGVGEPSPVADVSASKSAVSPEEKRRRVEALRRLLSTPPPAGRNLLIVSHNGNLRDAAGAEFADIAEGEVVVFQPADKGTFRKVARIHPESIWTEWSRGSP
jgi:broad specificity phosphatase PhoE